jgi:hydroxymethylglutaryl-CoA reductase (NADPH)
MPRYRLQTGFGGCHIRELEIAKLTHPLFRRIAPKFYTTWRDDEAGIYAIVMECLDQLSHMHTVDNIEAWGGEQIHVALRDIAAFHSIYYGKEQELASMSWLEIQTAERMVGMKDLWEALVDHNSYEYPEIITWHRTELIQQLIAALPEIWSHLEASPRTLVHNDFNLRNIGLRRVDGGDLRLCLYDWELATVHVPQHDVAEFLSFVLPPGSDERPAYVEFYRQQLEEFTAQEIDPVRFKAIFDLTCYELILNRFAAYSMAHTFKELSFLGRVLESHFSYLESLADRSGELPPLATLERLADQKS